MEGGGGREIGREGWREGGGRGREREREGRGDVHDVHLIHFINI